MKVSFSVITLLFIHLISFSQDRDNEELKSTEKGKKHTAIRFAPAFFWNTVGLEFEKQLGKRTSIGLNATITYGRDVDNDVLVQASSQNSAILNQGVAIDLIAKRYFDTDFNNLFFFMAASYNSIEYFNIDKKPYTLFNQLSNEKKEEILENNTRVTNSYGASFGVGYQIMMIPNHLIVNIEGGIAGYVTITNTPFFSLFLMPSIGYKF